MTNQNHLEILKQGLVRWNAWRKENVNIRPDLSSVVFSAMNIAVVLSQKPFEYLNFDDANLSGADLRGIHFHLLKAGFHGLSLRKAHLIGANLCGVNLDQQDLQGANLSGANLSQASLREAHLREAIFMNAMLNATDLRQADLSDVDLRNANLRKADLRGVDLSGADLSEADLSDANLVNFSKEQRNSRENMITPTTMLENTKFKKTNLCRSDLSGLDLRQVDFRETILDETNLSDTHLEQMNLSGKRLVRTNLSGANLSHANLSRIVLEEVNLHAANLSNTDLRNARLRKIDLSDADLSNADFSFAHIRESDLSKAYLCKTQIPQGILTDCRIHGISAWDVDLEETTQKDLIITRAYEATITVNNLEIAQFIYLLLNNQKLRQVIDTITSQVVLVVGHFAGERNATLQILKNELTKRNEEMHQNYSPVIFDLRETSSDSFAETIRTLANMSRFVIVDPTNAGTVLNTIETIITYCRVPIQPLLQDDFSQEYRVVNKLSQKHFWVLPPYRYRDNASLSVAFREKIIALEKKGQELRQRKPVKVFFGYTSKDEKIVDQLKTHLYSLERFGQIEMWDKRNIGAGNKWEEETETALSDAHLLLLLISPDFLASNDFNTIQRRAIERYESGEARVIPIILRDCNWEQIPLLGSLEVLPKDNLPIRSSKRRNRDEILAEVSGSIIDVIKDLS